MHAVSELIKWLLFAVVGCCGSQPFNRKPKRERKIPQCSASELRQLALSVVRWIIRLRQHAIQHLKHLPRPAQDCTSHQSWPQQEPPRA
jgi:hypothetical protein